MKQEAPKEGRLGNASRRRGGDRHIRHMGGCETSQTCREARTNRRHVTQWLLLTMPRHGHGQMVGRDHGHGQGRGAKPVTATATASNLSWPRPQPSRRVQARSRPRPPPQPPMESPVTTAAAKQGPVTTTATATSPHHGSGHGDRRDRDVGDDAVLRHGQGVLPTRAKGHCRRWP